jgi:hypothetical protein
VSYPVTPALEVFGNCSSCVATSTYGTTSPASGTTESWVMGAGYTTFPAAANNAGAAPSPSTYFYIRDPADVTNEIVLVYVGGSSGTTWSVMRGALGTTPVAHSAGATWVQEISPDTLGNFKQSPGAYLTSPANSVTLGTSTTETVISSYQPAAFEMNAGTVFELPLYGSIQKANGAPPTLQWKLYWGGTVTTPGSAVGTGGTSLLTLVTGTGGPALTTTMAAGSSFDLDLEVTLLAVSGGNPSNLAGNMNFWWSPVSTAVSGSQTVSATGTSVSGAGAFILTAKWSASSSSNTLTAVAPAWRRGA